MRDSTSRFSVLLLVYAGAVAASACDSAPGRTAAGPTEPTRDPVPEIGAAAAPTKPVTIGLAPSSDDAFAGPAPPEAIGAAALTDIEGLPFLGLDERSRHASSYDRSGGNVDFGNAYGVDSSGNWILLDTRGPGCIYRMWFTGFAGSDEIKMFFDDEAVP